MDGMPEGWEASPTTLAGLAYVEACAPLFEALDGAAAALVARGWEPREARAVVAWNYVSTVLAGLRDVTGPPS